GLHGWDGIESILVTIPREAQRVITADSSMPELEDFVERHARRALYVPARAVPEPGRPAPRAPSVATVGYVPVPEEELPAAAAAVLTTSEAAAGARLYCRSAAAAEALASELELRGFDATVDGSIVVVGAGDGLAVSYGVPVDAEALLARHGEGGIVLVAPRHTSHLHRIAGDANVVLEPRTLPTAEIDAEVEQFRETLRRAATEEDLAAQIMVLEPLLHELSALELAAAASALLRRAPAKPPVEEPVAAPEAAPPAYVRLFISVGSRDNVRPGDLVGAITGEADVPAAVVGRIEIRDTFSIVEVTRDYAERVLKALNGITLKGRSIRADYDRKGSTPVRRRAPGGQFPSRG
ncbi:MAG TPA: DbpA RNA binding domain-containing protein, partial [Longimicrobiales bacterium]|nr:DbpA RNA binding domain-containing protein [Longimicrobiales bacterium]